MTLADTAPREGLIRYSAIKGSAPNLQFRDDGADGSKLGGYAITFDSVTRIDSWEGEFDEKVDRNAVQRSLKTRTPIVQFDHGRHPMIGSLPVGRLADWRADQRGLDVDYDIFESWMTEPLRSAVTSGAITGQSFRFDVVKDEWDFSGDIPLRTLLDVEIFEMGPVVFPAYEDTTIAPRNIDGRRAEESSAERARLDEEGEPKFGSLTVAERLRWGQFTKQENRS